MKGLILLNAKVSIKHMKTYVKTSAKALGLTNTLKALDFAVEAHNGQKRKKSDIP